MTQHQRNISDFNRKVDPANAPELPIVPTAEQRCLRVQLIADELLELCAALDVELSIIEKPGGPEAFVSGGLGKYDERGAYDAELDLDYVVTGTASAFGHDMGPGQIEVNRSNHTKFIDGHRRADGKWVKGPSYSPAVLGPILEEMKKRKSIYETTAE